MSNTNTIKAHNEQKHVGKSEFVLYLMGVFFYTTMTGIMMFLAGVPFFFYKLTGKTKEDYHNALLAKRAEMAENQNA